MQKNAKMQCIRLVCTLIAISALLIGILYMRQVYFRPSDQCIWEDLESGVTITGVIPGGAAERAGLLVGDILLRIAGENATASERAQNVLDNQRVGEEIEYWVLRGQNLLTLTVKVVPGSFSPTLALMLTVGFIFLVVGWWIGFMRPDDGKALVLFFLFLQFMIFWILNVYAPLGKFLQILRMGFLNLAFFSIPVLFLIFFLLFPTRHASIRNKWGWIILIAPCLVVLLLFPVTKVQEDISWKMGLILWGGYFTIALIRLWRSARNIADTRVLQQIRVLQWGLLLGLIPALVIILSSMLGKEISFAKYLLPLMGLIPLTFAYTVVKHRLMDIEILVRNSFVYTILTGIIIGFYHLLIQLSGHFFLNVSGMTGSVVLMISTLLLAIAFDPARKRIQKIIDRAFFREAYDYRKILHRFSRTLNTLMDPDVLTETVIEKICQTMKIETAFFFAGNPSSGYLLLKSFPVSEFRSLPIISDRQSWITTLKRNQRPVRISDLENEDIGPIKKDLALEKGGVCVPLTHRENLSGFLILGAKQSGMVYSSNDLELLETLADQVSVSLENGRLHRALTEQERIKKELEIARQIQLNSLPHEDPSIPGFDVYGTSIPAEEVGGDYYDYIAMPRNRWAFFIGDVSGKGTPAALYLSKIQGFIRATIDGIRSIGDLFEKINQLTCDNIESKSFVTMSGIFLNPKTRQLDAVRAGHSAILYYHADSKTVERWMPDGIGLGLAKGSLFRKSIHVEKRKILPGDVLFLYTDGLNEAENDEGKEFGEPALEKIFQKHSRGDARTIGDEIIQEIQEFSAAKQKDDMTLVIIKSIEPKIGRKKKAETGSSSQEK